MILAAVQRSRNQILHTFLAERFAGIDDYLSAVESVWGENEGLTLRSELNHAAEMVSTVTSGSEQKLAEEFVAEVLLTYMPEPDFRMAILDVSELDQGSTTIRVDQARINRICGNRSLGWEFTRSKGFRWTGDEEVRTRAIGPARSAVEDVRFVGVKADFDPAQTALATGTPTELKRCVHESACAIESAMKIVLAEHGDSYDETATAFALFERLVQAERIPKFMEKIVLGPAVARN